MQSALTARAIAPPPPPPPRAVERYRRRRVRGTRTTTHASSSGRTDGGEDDAPKSSTRDRSYTRRAALAGYALAPSALSFLAGAPPSDAKLELIYDGELQTAYTFPVQLKVIALRGSVATQWEGEFNNTMVGKGKAAVTTAPSPGEMFDELTRILNHLLWLGAHALDIGAMSVYFYCFRDRLDILLGSNRQR